MRILSIALVLLVVTPCRGIGGNCELPAWPCYEQGMPVPILFEYEGGIESWDGAIGWLEIDGDRRLSVSNCCFLVVSRGLDEFRPPVRKEGVSLMSWQRFKAPRGELVPPKGKEPYFGQFMVKLGPFSTLVDLSEIYDIESPGVYTVWWGIRCGQEIECESEIIFEILPKGALERSALKVEALMSGEG